MISSYAQKPSIIQKVASSKAASVLDSSSQSESLQRKAGLTNNAAQLEDSSRPNNTGMPDNLKAGIESLSGFSMDDVRVHYNSSKPATVQALAYTQGTDIHVASGQEKCLPHEAWHVAQQLAGRVSPTTNINGMPVNNNAALEHEADVMGEKAASSLVQKSVVQCASKLANSFGRPIQRTTTFTDINGYENAYGPEIEQTGTYDALKYMEDHGPEKIAYGTPPLRFTDDYRMCGVTRSPDDTHHVICIKIPDPQAPVDMKCENVKNLSSKLTSMEIKRMFAVHELEHLRLFYKNSGENLNNMSEDAGEPSMNPTITNCFVLLKKNICDSLGNAVPKNLNIELKNYIKERLGYIMRPKKLEESDDFPENKTARELTTVLIELMKFCECYSEHHPEEYVTVGMDKFKTEVLKWYDLWK